MKVTSASSAASVRHVSRTSTVWSLPRSGRHEAVKGPDPLEQAAVQCNQLGGYVVVDVSGPRGGAFDVQGRHPRLLDLDPQRPVVSRF